MNRIFLFSVAVGVLGFAFSAARASAMPQVGQKAPLVSGTNQEGKEWRLADLIGKKNILLYFYPKDQTPGCTKEACGLRDRMGDLKRQDVEVVGVSCDTVESHKAFIAAQGLNFTLVSDPDALIANTYGARALGLKLARRVSFLIDREGKIVHITDAMSADTHLKEMQAAIAALRHP
jgi:peroxiredoxin Q/BCP